MAVIGPDIDQTKHGARIKAMLVGRYGLAANADAAAVRAVLASIWGNWLRAEVTQWESELASSTAATAARNKATDELKDLV